MQYIDTIKNITDAVATVIEGLASIVIIYATVKAFYEYFKYVILPGDEKKEKTKIRFSLGKSLVVALELLLGADILKTAMEPNWNEIGQLAAIAALRTLLNYFLDRELKNGTRENNIS